jgi:oligopeptide transport system permease protein
MTKYIVNRLFRNDSYATIIITLSFFIVRIAPGGPFATERNLPRW